MRDPLVPPTSVVTAIEPIASYLGLPTLPFHFHEIIIGWAFYQFISSVASPVISTLLLPSMYSGFPQRTKLNWNVHVTSFIQSIFISTFALLVIWNDRELRDTDWSGRVWGYSGACGAVQGFAAGYFLWDLIIGVVHLKELGIGSLAHASSALLITSIGFRPFANYYGLNFVLYELSTPFLNIHWFTDKVGMTGSRFQLYNGIILLLTFFGCRVVWGNYQSFRIYSDVWTAFNTQNFNSILAGDDPIFAFQRSYLKLARRSVNDQMALPTWLVIVYLGSNTVLNILNIYWFSKMVQAVIKRFESADLESKDIHIKKDGTREHIE